MLGLFKRENERDRLKILVVDDDVTITQIIQRRFESYGWEVLTSANGEKGLKEAQTRKPDLIILDINMPNMPVMNGHDMLERLRRDVSLKDTPVIMCTGSDQVKDITKAASHGVFSYITKPFSCAALGEKVVEALSAESS